MKHYQPKQMLREEVGKQKFETDTSPGHKKKSVVISVMSAGNIIFRSLCVHTDGGTLYCFC